jgi:hypothetical protein
MHDKGDYVRPDKRLSTKACLLCKLLPSDLFHAPAHDKPFVVRFSSLFHGFLMQDKFDVSGSDPWRTQNSLVS